jgi:hypothetical protein
MSAVVCSFAVRIFYAIITGLWNAPQSRIDISGAQEYPLFEKEEHMKWSKLKKTAEGFLADSLKKRIKYHVTRYTGFTMSRGWMTFDGQEIANFSNVEHMMQHWDVAEQIRSINQNTDFDDPVQQAGYKLANAEAKEILLKDGVFSRDDFYGSLEEYVQLSLDEALDSGNQIIRGLALLDRRFGMRRLKSMKSSELAMPFVVMCHRIRSEAEGVQVPE